ncbi:MAG: ComF family protein [Lachnospiraceae bacterium]
MKKELLELLYPPRCPLCDEVKKIPQPNESRFAGSYVCGPCFRTLQYTGETVCARCGKPISNPRKEYCDDCMRHPHAFTQGKAVFHYQGSLRNSLYRFKYSNRRQYASFYGEEAARLYGSWIYSHHVEAIVPIPLHPKKKRQRGYNQAQLFAKELGKRLRIPVRTDLLKRIYYTNPQKELNARERKKNLKKALKISQTEVKLKNILIVDDIYTTGSTMDAAAEAFLEKGVQNIYFLTIGIGEGY